MEDDLRILVSWLGLVARWSFFKTFDGGFVVMTKRTAAGFFLRILLLLASFLVVCVGCVVVVVSCRLYHREV